MGCASGGSASGWCGLVGDDRRTRTSLLSARVRPTLAHLPRSSAAVHPGPIRRRPPLAGSLYSFVSVRSAAHIHPLRRREREGAGQLCSSQLRTNRADRRQPQALPLARLARVRTPHSRWPRTRPTRIAASLPAPARFACSAAGPFHILLCLV